MASPRVRIPARPRLRRRTARLRFTALYGGLFLLSGVALVATTYVLFERATEYRQPQLPRVPRTPAIQSLRMGLQGPLAQTLPQLARDQYQLAQAQRSLAQNFPVKPAGGEALGRLLPIVLATPRLASDEAQLSRDQQQLAAVQRQLAAAVHQVARAGSVQAAQRRADSHQLLVDSGIALAVVAVLALLAGWLVAGRMLRPIRTITRTARRISSVSLHERLALDGPPDELKELGDTLDELFDRLEVSFEAQRLFVANASHELRTPLARQRALIQVALSDPQASFTSLRAAHERVLASEQHLEEVIDALLDLTRGQAGGGRRERVALAAVAAHALAARDADIAGARLELRATLAPACVDGDPRLIERMLANLIDNSIRHNAAGGGHVEIATGIRDELAFVAIANSGPAIAPEEVQRLFEPFERLAGRGGSRGGHGLGLSIVRAVASAHGAELTAAARPEGGFAVEVAFPSAPALPALAGRGGDPAGALVAR